MDGGSSLGMVIIFVTVSLADRASTIFALSFRIVRVSSFRRPIAKKLLFSYSSNLGLTERLEALFIWMVINNCSPMK